MDIELDDMEEGELKRRVFKMKYHETIDYVYPGVRFFKEVSRASIIRTELDDPFKGLVLYELHDVDTKPLDVSKIPKEAWPYPNCFFDVLSEPDRDTRFSRLKEFFSVLGAPGDPSERVGLFYTIMHFWKNVYGAAMSHPTPRMENTIKFFLDAGIFQNLIRIVGRSNDKPFLLNDYNRMVPYRCLELIFAATQAAYTLNDSVVRAVLEDPDRTYHIFYPLICGRLSCLEEIIACQLAANFSCYPTGVTWLLNHPQLVGKIGTHMWYTYELIYKNIHQYQEVMIPYVKYLIHGSVDVVGKDHVYKPTPVSFADLNVFVVLCCLCNVCAAHPEDEPMERVEPCLLAVVREGLFNNMGTAIYGIILNDNKYHDELLVEKFLSFLSWSCFQRETQRLAIEQLNSLPTHRDDFPLFFNKNSFSKSRSVLACLITHACHLDYEKGSHFATLALIYLMKENEDVAMEVVRWVGDTLFDMSHSIYHAMMPSPEQKPISLKRMVLQTILKFGGSSIFDENGSIIKPSKKRFEEPVPECVNEAREFCERYVKQMKMTRYEKQKLVRCADEFKAEGNRFFIKRNYYSAIDCYTKALEICPLTCTERRVTYYSNRAECYLKTNRAHRAMRDCTKALAQNPSNLRTRWRRAQAFKSMQRKFPAALDLLTIRRHEVEAKQILGERLYTDLDGMILELMDQGRYFNSIVAKSGKQVFSSEVVRELSLNAEQKENRLGIPPFRGRYYHEIFGNGVRPCYSSK